ncbi:MAG: MBL fold metallo-hydrolase [Candidatus Saganbacteria bacterium]|nr:MBL fold metallo-hydrolase [Candidatus Saganbacteria bacterium]
MELDVERPETWPNLKKFSRFERKTWIISKMPLILRTIERYISASVDYRDNSPWDTIGFICLDDGLYKEAEHIYDDMIKRSHHRETVLNHLLYCRGISKFLQGKFKNALEDFKQSNHMAHIYKQKDLGAARALMYMEDTIFPMIDMVSRSKEKLRNDLNVVPFLDKAVGANILKTLHKWNSCSPLFSTGVSQGGGYLLTLKNHLGAVKSIAIDPGYEFLEIFKDLDLSIVDLDAIIATHDHDDHTESIEAILSLLAKHNDHVPQSRAKTLDVFGSPGVMLKYQGLFNALDPWGNREINFKLLVPGATIDHVGTVSLKEKYGCTVHVKQAFHEELWTHEESAVGLVIETNIEDKAGHPVCVGVTGDSRYEKGLGEQYKGCQVLLFNIGSLEKEEGKLLDQHLGLIGSINVIKEAKPKVAVLTEFGEEFSGKRATVASVIEEWAAPMEGVIAEDEFKVIPADMHFEIRLTDLYVKETSSHVFLPYKMIEVEESGSDSIMYNMKEKR